MGDIGDVRLALEGAFETAAPQTPGAAPPSARATVGVDGSRAVAWLAALAVPAVRHLRERRRQPTRWCASASPRPLAPVARWDIAGFQRGAGRPDPRLCRHGRGRRVRVSSSGVSMRPRRNGSRARTARRRPFWAPDSRSLGFAKEGGLYRVALDGSAPRRLCDVPGSSFRGGTWSARGVIVFAAQTGGSPQVPDTGGTPTPVTTLDAAAKEVAHGWPWFLPDGRHVLFLALAEGQTGAPSGRPRLTIRPAPAS